MSRPFSVLSLLVWDSPRYTGNLLSNLEWAPPSHDYPWHLHIIDQGSEPETKDLLRAWVPPRSGVSAQLLANNVGYGAGHNFVYASMLAQQPFDYFVTINSDVVFGAPDWLDTLVQAMEANPRAAIGGPFAYTREILDDKHFLLAPATPEQCRAGAFEFITGAVAIIRARAVEELGLFDEIFSPAYFEDQDMVARYQHFGWEQLHIDIPVLHGYLGNAERVNEAKRAALDAEHGDFRHRNMMTYTRRWRHDPLPTSPEDLRRRCPRLYFPQPARAGT